MADRSDKRRKRNQQPPTYYESDGEESGDWASPKPAPRETANQSSRVSRSRRAGTASKAPSVTVERPLSSPIDDSKKSMHLTVKMSTNKLREVTGATQRGKAIKGKDASDTEETVVPARNSRSKRAIVEESDSEDDVAEPILEDEMDEDDIEEEEDESEDADADDDVEMEDAPAHPPPPIIKSKAGLPGSKPALTVTPANEGKLKSVEAKEMELDDEDDDEELSELESEEEEDGEEDEEEDEEVAEDDQVEEDAEGDEELEGDEEGAEVEDDEDDDEEEDSEDDATPATGSRASTPDFAKLTKRQRARGVHLGDDHLLQLPLEAQKKKHLTAEEHLMRRTEMARRRKNLSEKRNEEEKMDTINKLLKKQAPKRRGRVAPADTAGDMTPVTQEPEIEKPKSTVVRWVSNRDGVRLGVPEEWLGTPAGRIFESSTESDLKANRMVEEIG